MSCQRELTQNGRVVGHRPYGLQDAGPQEWAQLSLLELACLAAASLLGVSGQHGDRAQRRIPARRKANSQCGT